MKIDTKANWLASNLKPINGELCYASDSRELKIGDGDRVWRELKTVAVDSVQIDQVEKLSTRLDQIEFTLSKALTTETVGGVGGAPFVNANGDVRKKVKILSQLPGYGIVPYVVIANDADLTTALGTYLVGINDVWLHVLASDISGNPPAMFFLTGGVPYGPINPFVMNPQCVLGSTNEEVLFISGIDETPFESVNYTASARYVTPLPSDNIQSNRWHQVNRINNMIPVHTNASSFAELGSAKTVIVNQSSSRYVGVMVDPAAKWPSNMSISNIVSNMSRVVMLGGRTGSCEFVKVSPTIVEPLPGTYAGFGYIPNQADVQPRFDNHTMLRTNMDATSIPNWLDVTKLSSIEIDQRFVSTSFDLSGATDWVIQSDYMTVQVSAPTTVDSITSPLYADHAAAFSKFTLEVTNNLGAQVITWPGTVSWPGGAVPTPTAGVDVYEFMGTSSTTWRARLLASYL